MIQMRKKSIGLLLIMTLFIVQMHATAYAVSGSYTSIYDDNEHLFSELSGKVSFIDCFATWCPSCKALHPELQKVYRHFGDQINILSLSIDVDSDPDTPDKLRTYAQTYPFDWGRAGIDTNRDFQNAYELGSIPALFLFDEDGVNIRMWNGVVSSDDLISVVNLLLGITDTSSTSATPTSSETSSLLAELIKNPFVQFSAFLVVFIVIILKRK